MIKNCAGLLMYRNTNENGIEVFLVHAGGPYWQKVDKWGIPKGHIEENELIFEAAKREFIEETSINIDNISTFIFVCKFKCGRKYISVWAFNNDFNGEIKSNVTQIEFPKNSGVIIEIPEIDKGKYFSINESKQKIYETQLQIIEEFEKII